MANETINDLPVKSGGLAGTEKIEIDDGASKSVTTQQIADLASGGGSSQPVSIQVAISDETTAITTGTAKITFRTPYAFTLTNVRASLATASSSGAPVFDINMGGTSLLSTKLSIDASEKTSTTAATPPVISNSTITDDAEITIDVDTSGTGAKGAKITLIGTYP
jgi:hypothetical protein